MKIILGEQYLDKTNCKKRQRSILYAKGNQQGDIKTVYINIYVPNIEAPTKYIKKILTNIKAETDNSSRGL